jgi:hypothetical protein
LSGAILLPVALQVRHLLDRILVADPTKRASIADIEADPWFIGPDGYHDDGDNCAPGGGAGGPATSAAFLGAGAGAGAGAAASKPLAHAPSEKEIEDAVAEVGEEHSSPAAGSGASPAAGGAGKSAGPPALNAFEVRSYVVPQSTAVWHPRGRCRRRV